MTRWAQGEARISQLLELGHVEFVMASEAHAASLLEDASRHLASAELLAESDPSAAYSVMYDGARKALAAVLSQQGLRATSAGGHVAVQDAVEAQLGALKHVIAPFGRLRRRRNRAEYPDVSTPSLTSDEVLDELPKARELVDTATQLVGQMGAWVE